MGDHRQTYQDTPGKRKIDATNKAVVWQSYTKQNLNNITNKVTDIEDQDQEIIWTEIKQGRQITYIGTYYGPQENTPIEEVDREISQIRTQINKMKQKGGIILTGDFNAKIKINNDNTQQNESRNGTTRTNNRHKPHTNITQS